MRYKVHKEISLKFGSRKKIAYVETLNQRKYVPIRPYFFVQPSVFIINRFSCFQGYLPPLYCTTYPRCFLFLVNSRLGDLRPPCTLAFAAGAWTPPLTKRLLRRFGNPAIGSHVASHGAYSVAVKLQGFHQIDPLPPPH